MEEGRREGAHLRYPDLLDDIVLPILLLPNKEGPAVRTLPNLLHTDISLHLITYGGESA